MGEDYKKQAYEQPQSEERPAWVSPHQPMMGEWYRLASRQVPPMPPKGAQVDSRAYLRQKIV